MHTVRGMRGRKRYGEPGGGEWFGLQKHMHERLAAHEERAGVVTVAWQKENGGYIFGIYKDAQTLHAALMRLAPDARFLFEQIEREKPCRAYADVEWMGAADPGHTRMREFCRRLHAWCAQRYEMRPELYVNTSSCATAEPGVHKHSYHVVIRNLIFPTNHTGEMSEFWSAFASSELSAAEWYYTKKNKKGGEKRAHIIDNGVYTMSRNLRCSLCRKRGGQAFARINGSATDGDDDLTAVFRDDDPEAFIPFLVGNADAHEPGCVVVPRRAAPGKAAAREEGPREPKRARTGGAEDAHEALPECVRAFLLVPGESAVKADQIRHPPRAVRTQVTQGLVKEEDVRHLYIQNPRCCVTKRFVEGKEHKHPGNNSMCVVVPPHAAYPFPQVYVRCLCEDYKAKRLQLSRVHDKYKELPAYAKYARRALETEHGLAAVQDAEFRARVKDMYTRHKNGPLSFLGNPSNLVLWQMYLESYDDSWFLLPLRRDDAALPPGGANAP